MRHTTYCGILSVCLAAQVGFAAESKVDSPTPKPATQSEAIAATPAPAVATPPVERRNLGGIEWHTNYAAAYQQAQTEKKMLFIYFRDNRDLNLVNSFESDVLSKPELHPSLKSVVPVVLGMDVADPFAPAAKPGKLLDHSAFVYMYRKTGLAMIDLIDDKLPVYGKVVSAHPFTPGRHYTVTGTRLMLTLPRGTVTQRAMVYAVRLHPEAPPSTNGIAHPFLMESARRNSAMMAQMESVGHHDWGTRTGEISSATGYSATEAAAVGFGQESLIDAAVSCVNLWQTSGAHWVMVASPCAAFGYDMVRGPSGNWYGTGIFGN